MLVGQVRSHTELICFAGKPTYAAEEFTSDAVIERHLFQGTIGPATTYYVRGEMKDGVCKAWIAETKSKWVSTINRSSGVIGSVKMNCEYASRPAPCVLA